MSKALHFTDSNFQSEVLGSQQPVLVDFWAPWCPPCRALAPTIEELASQYDGSVKVGKLNIDEGSQAALHYGVESIPTVLLLKDGKVVERLVGAQSKRRYEQAIRQAAA